MLTEEGSVNGPVKTKVTMSLEGGSVLTAIVTEQSTITLKPAASGHDSALVKASRVILGLDA